MTEGVEGDPPDLSGVCDADASPNLPPTGDTLATESILIFQNTTFKLEKRQMMFSK